jgi:hypothetical protein
MTEDETTNQPVGLAELPGEDNSPFSKLPADAWHEETDEDQQARQQAMQRTQQLLTAKRTANRNARIGRNDPNRYP